MPLIKNKAKKPVSKEIEADLGKQDLAIALNVARQARKKRMAMGGVVKPEDQKPSKKLDFTDSEGAELITIDNRKKEADEDNMAHGGKVKSIAEAIMQRKKMAHGGEVDHNNTEEVGFLDELNEELANNSIVNDPEIHQPEDSNEHGVELEDENDHVAKIMRKMKIKRGL